MGRNPDMPSRSEGKSFTLGFGWEGCSGNTHLDPSERQYLMMM